MPLFKLRTLLILLAVLPPLLAEVWFVQLPDPYKPLGWACAATPVIAIVATVFASDRVYSRRRESSN